ncbi:MAG: PBECR4 domain-containing protein [Clostridia bacterium]
MDELFACAKSFEKLLNIKYHIILGRKENLIDLNIVFTKWDFHHLIGLGKLKDLRVARQNREEVFNSIISNKTTYDKICTSRYISQIEDRFFPLSNIEKLFDDNNIIFRYNEKVNMFSLIQADFLLSTPLNEDDIYIFISQKEDNTYFCRSFFPKTNRDYTKGQTKYTLLYKEKINLKSGETVVQYDKLRK